MGGGCVTGGVGLCPLGGMMAYTAHTWGGGAVGGDVGRGGSPRGGCGLEVAVPRGEPRPQTLTPYSDPMFRPHTVIPYADPVFRPHPHPIFRPPTLTLRPTT